MRKKRLRHRQSGRCISHNSLSRRLDYVHCRQIQQGCSNPLRTMLDVLILVPHLSRKSFHNRRQLHIEAHRIIPAPNKPSVLWKHHEGFRHRQRHHTRQRDFAHLPPTPAPKQDHVPSPGPPASSCLSTTDASSGSASAPGSLTDPALISTTKPSSRSAQHTLPFRMLCLPHTRVFR